METQELSIEAIITREMAKMLNMKAKDVDVNKAFDRLGLDSHDIVSFAGELGEKLNTEIDPVIFYEFNTIAEISKHLTKELGGKK